MSILAFAAQGIDFYYEDQTPGAGAPNFIGGITVANIGLYGFTAFFNVDENSTAHIVVVPQGSTAPTSEQIIAGSSYVGGTVLFNSSKSVSANVQDSFVVSGIAGYEGQALTAYITSIDVDGNTQSADQIRSVTLSLQAINNPPTVSGNYSRQTVAVGQSVSFDASVNFTDTDALSYSIIGLTGATINTNTGVITWVPSTASDYTGTVTATDTAGQSASAQLPFSVIDAPAPVAAPYNRKVEWLNVKTPDLVIGDTFVQTLTLKQGSPQENCNVLAAESIKSAIVTDDNSMVLSDVVSLSSSATGAAWVNGVLVVDLGEAVTAQAASEIKKLTYGKIEIEVVLNGDSFTWFAPVRLIPGYID